jgi:phosphoenolpyruvate-protein kinase (PTS system EI component)
MFLHAKFKKLKQREKLAERKQEILREKKLFVLDNSLRESTVGQLRGHTIENKWKIYEEVKNMLSKNVLIKDQYGNCIL